MTDTLTEDIVATFLDAIARLDGKAWTEVRARSHLVELVVLSELSRNAIGALLIAARSTRGLPDETREMAILAAVLGGAMWATHPRRPAATTVPVHPLESILPYSEDPAVGGDLLERLEAVDSAGWTTISERMASIPTRADPKKIRTGVRLLDRFIDATADLPGIAVWETWCALEALARPKRKPGKFAPSYMPFSRLIPLDAPVSPAVGGLLAWLDDVNRERWQMVAEVTPAPSISALAEGSDDETLLLSRDSEIAVALRALEVGPALLPGEPGWNAVKNAIAAARVLCLARTEEQLQVAWEPFEGAVPLDAVRAGE